MTFKHAKANQRLVIGLCFLMLVMNFSGCASMRKKFVRQKKKGKNVEKEFVPVLDPREYEPVVFLAEEKYRHHYNLWKVWEKTLNQEVMERSSEKRLLYTINQLLVHVYEMRKRIVEDQQAMFDDVIAGYEKIQKGFQDSDPIGLSSRIERRLRLLEKKVRNELAPQKVKDYYVMQKEIIY
jgi:hypothetical protein